MTALPDIRRAARRGAVLLAGLAPLAAATPAAAQPRVPPGLDAYVTQAVKAWNTPGLSIAVVHHDSIVFIKGYGVRELGKPAPVDEHTLFAIGSTTKAMTATLMAMLVDSGKVSWDDPVVDHLPDFQLSDPYVTRALTIRDILTHRTGLGTLDRVWYGMPIPYDTILHRLRYHPIESSPRSHYAYQNIMYATAGAIVSREMGMPWAQALLQRIDRPLGITDIAPTYEALQRAQNVAQPHDSVDGAMRPIPYRDIDNIAPAGAVNASARAMATWIRFVLDSGRTPDGRRLISEASWREMMTPQFLIPPGSFYPTTRLTKPHFIAYGFGWFLEDYRGALVAMHTGSIDGMSAVVGLLPEYDAGVVVLANRDHAELRHALMWRVLDFYLGAPQRDWSTELHRMYDALAAEGRAAQARRDSSRVANTSPSHPLDAYTGTYADSLYGEVTVAMEGGHLVVRAGPAFIADLSHWHYDTFQATWRDHTLGTSLLTFSTGADGKVRAMQLPGMGTLERENR